jgi:membrane protein
MKEREAVIRDIIHFITTDIWRIRLKDISRSKSFFLKQLRIILLAVRGFDEDRCQLRASALTFYSLLSIVPVIAILFGIAKGFGFQEVLEKELLQNFSAHEAVLVQVMEFAKSLLETTQGGLIAGIGLLVLFWTVIKVLGSIERSFNNVWGVKSPRPWSRKFTDYISVLLIAPILFILASSIMVFITSQVTFITEKFALLGFFSSVIFFLLKLLPYCIVWILFTFIYIFMPNTKVRFTSGLVAGIVAGSIYQLVQWGYIAFQVGVAKYNAIYGSFAALPLFLVWLQLSWLVVLFGAEISFSHQNVDTYEFEPDCLHVSVSFKKLLSLRIVHLLVKNFSAGKSPLAAAAIAHTLEVPIRLVRQMLFELVESGILSEVATREYEETAYQPGRDSDSLTIQYVIDALEKRGVDSIPTAQTEELKVLSESLQTFNDVIVSSPANKLLKNI